MISEEIAVAWDSLSEETKNQVVVGYLKSLSKWNFKRILCNVLDVEHYMDDEGLRKAVEGVSEELSDYINELSKQFQEVSFAKLSRIAVRVAKWQKENLWKHADGDDLPEIDREVIAILDYDFGHYKVVYAHRPNPNGWNGTNIDTGEKEHFEPVIYDKGGWNQPHVLYWLDTRLPYEENKITK